jgi:hypothetical protein
MIPKPHLLVLLGGVLVLVSAHGQTAAKIDLPSDVVDFRNDRDKCDHFRGEDSDDPKRQQSIRSELQRYCTGTDLKLHQLKLKYRNSKGIMKLLNRYEPTIE